MRTHRFQAEHRARLKDEGRRRAQPAQGIIDRASPGQDEVVADVGCGNGYVSIPLAARCRVVLAVDSQRAMLEDLMASAGELGRLRIVPVRAEATRLPFSGASVDRAVVVNVFHEAPDRERLAEELERILRAGGRCTLVEFQRKVTSFGPPLHERIEEAEIPSFFPSLRVLRLHSFDEFYQYEMVRL